MSTEENSGERQHLLVDLTSVGPEDVLNIQSPPPYTGSLESSSVSSVTAKRRTSAADKLNRKLLFGETTRPEDLDPEWSFVSSKNLDKRTSHATSTLDTFIHLLKANIGPGLLALPFAVSKAGYILGPIAVLIIAIITTHCMGMLLDSARRLCEWNGIQALDYAETMQFAFKEQGARPLTAKIAKLVVNVFLIITQFGFCSVYFVFIGETLHQVMSQAYCLEWSPKVYTAIMIPPIIIFSWIRNLDSLAPLSVVANICMWFGLGVVIYDEIYRFSTTGPNEAIVYKDIDSLNIVGTFITISLFLGNAMYSFEGIGIVLPLENKMKNPKLAKPVIYTGMAVVVVLFCSFSLMGYLVYGNSIQASVPLNLCGTDEVTTTVFILAKLSIALSVFITYALQFYVPMDFLEPYVYKLIKLDFVTYKYPRHHNIIQTSVQITFRTTIVLITAALALSIPDLDDLITLIGAIASSALALLFPPVIDILTFWKDPERKWFVILPKPVWVVKDIAIFVFGIVGFVLGTFAALYRIVNYYEHKDGGVDACQNGFVYKAACHYVS